MTIIKNEFIREELQAIRWNKRLKDYKRWWKKTLRKNARFKTRKTSLETRTCRTDIDVYKRQLLYLDLTEYKFYAVAVLLTELDAAL